MVDLGFNDTNSCFFRWPTEASHTHVGDSGQVTAIEAAISELSLAVRSEREPGIRVCQDPGKAQSKTFAAGKHAQ
jgi:hypothetical protein